MTVGLWKDNKRKTCYVHKLVAEAYIPNLDNLSELNHIDENKAHNYINNLCWINRINNVRHGTGIERQAAQHYKAVYCVELDRVFKSQTEAVAELNLPKSGISDCLTGRQKTTGGYHWKWAV